MNSNNKLNLKQGSFLRVLDLLEGITVAVPTLNKVANARVLKVEQDGSLKVHWKSNYNLNGDFRTEVMKFDSDLILNTGDLAERNSIRVANGLMSIK